MGFHFFSGFCLHGEKELFENFLEETPFTWAGFSFGAQQLWEKLRHWSGGRIQKIILLSPAYFGSKPEKWVQLNLAGFQRNREKYIRNFLQKGGLPDWKYLDPTCTYSQLEKGLNFQWEPIPPILKKVECHIYLGEADKIVDLEGAYSFFKKVGIVHLLKHHTHFLTNSSRE
jgi:hypothetical protein